MSNQIELIKEKLQEADYVLVGCGFDLEKNLTNLEEQYYEPVSKMGITSKETLAEKVQEKEAVEWIDAILKSWYQKNHTLPVYQQLYETIKEKNYFILSMNTSQYLLQAGFDEKKIVMPCGNEGLFQCSKSCTHKIEENESYVADFVKRLPEILPELQMGRSIQEYMPLCETCKERLTFNVRSQVETYVEEGYLPQWQAYMQWIARTLNRKLVLLELDVNFTLPSLIRWPFEKNAYINNKALLVRVNKTFPQLSEEIHGKGVPVPMSAEEFLELVNK
ncbi:hypothetical protein [Anaerosporobacter faecicola]|uniref:hypothetical protein n=1 Tax=Anaerosporobacter faecicola TaxID=2718714 RepID=UPI001439C109|nr:hypothetical protein [Anaerosporobacter faecicola]